jgi:hypothetical protein
MLSIDVVYPILGSDNVAELHLMGHEHSHVKLSSVTFPVLLATISVLVASDRNYTEKPRRNACLAVVSQHIWATRPAAVTVSTSASLSSDYNPVPVKLPGKLFSTRRS